MHIYTIWLRDNNNIYEGRDLVIQRMHYYRHTVFLHSCVMIVHTVLHCCCVILLLVYLTFSDDPTPWYQKCFFLCIKWKMSVKKIKCLEDYPTLVWNIRIKTTFENNLNIKYSYSACVQVFTLPPKTAEIQIQELWASMIM